MKKDVRSRKPGRPPTYSAPVRAALAELIRKHGIGGARRVSDIKVSNGTMVKIAREYGIRLNKGKRPALQPQYNAIEPSDRPPFLDLDRVGESNFCPLK